LRLQLNWDLVILTNLVLKEESIAAVQSMGLPFYRVSSALANIAQACSVRMDAQALRSSSGRLFLRGLLRMCNFTPHPI
jgi:hypothetical protein